MTDPHGGRRSKLEAFAKLRRQAGARELDGRADGRSRRSDSQQRRHPHVPLSRFGGAVFPIDVALQRTICRRSTKRPRCVRGPGGLTARAESRERHHRSVRANGPHAADRGRIEASCWPPTAFPTVETCVATSADEAVAQAARIGYPVVLKLHSETITHKTDVGGVQLNLDRRSRCARRVSGDRGRDGEAGGRTFSGRDRAADDSSSKATS